MGIGTEQLNSFDTFSLDCWKDHVYYEGQEFPAGHFAAEILNYAGEARDPLLERLCTLITLVDQAASAGKGEGVDVLAELRPLMKETVSWIYSCPPFCYQDDQGEWNRFALDIDANRFEQDCDTDPEHLPYLFLSLSEQVLKILVAIYNFCLLIRVVEQKYLRRLERRTDGAFAKAAHECLDEDDDFLVLLEQMPFGEIEEFSPYPRLISGFNYIQDTSDNRTWITVQHVVCKRLIDFYVFDLLRSCSNRSKSSIMRA